MSSTRTFGGQGNSRPFRSSCDPARVYDYLNNLLATVASGGEYTVSASTVVNASGTTLATLGPGDSYTVSTATCENVTVLGPTGNTLASVAAGGTYNVPASTVQWSSGGTAASLGPNGIYVLSLVNVLDYTGGTIANVEQGATVNVASSTVLWSTGGTAATLGPGANYQLSAVTVLNHTGGTVFNDAEHGQTRSLLAATVLDFSGGTLRSLAPSAQYTVPSAQTIVQNSTPLVLTTEIMGPGEIFTYTVQDVEISTNAPAQIVSVPSGVNYTLPDMNWVNSQDGDVENYLPIYYSGAMVVPDITVVDSGTGLSAATPVLTNGIANVNFSGTVTVENSNQSFTTGYTSYGTYVLPDINILNSTGQTIGTWPAVSAYTIAALTFENSTGKTLSFMNGVYPAGGTLQVPQFTIINSDGQSGTTFPYDDVVYTNFSAGTTASGITYQRPMPSPIGTVYHTGDTTWHANNGTYDWTSVSNPERLARVDYSATEADVRGVYYGPAGDGTDAIYPTYLEQNNAFGNRYRFTDDIGNPSDSSASSIWAHVDFNSHSYSGGATSNYIIDHVTGLGYYTQNVTNGTRYNLDKTDPADGQTWEEWLDHIRTGVTVGSYSDFRMPSWEEATSGPMISYHYNHEWSNDILEDFRRYMVTSTNYSSSACLVLWDSTQSNQFAGTLAKAGSGSFSHRIAYVFAIRTHY